MDLTGTSTARASARDERILLLLVALVFLLAAIA